MSIAIRHKVLLTFLAVLTFYFFEFAEMSYFNALAPAFLATREYTQHQIGALSAAYYYGNVFSLLPAGFILDHLSLRKTMLFALLGSVLGALLLVFAHSYSIAYIARFCCGMFGGTFSFIGGIRVLADIAEKRFALFMGIFLTAGMVGGSVCQYPLLWISSHIGTHYSIVTMFCLGCLVLLFNVICLHPKPRPVIEKVHKKALHAWASIFKNYRNWTDCFLIVFIDSPFTILGTLWGIVTITSIYHFNNSIGAIIISIMFLGSMFGSPLFGAWALKVRNQAILVFIATGLMGLIGLALILIPQLNVFAVTILFFILGFLTGSQTIVFTWLITNMRPELIGQNSAANSMLFMGAGGSFKQISAGLLLIPAIIYGKAAAVNLIMFISVMMLIGALYTLLRKWIFAN